MARRIEDIFNECLERINQGDSIEHCLADYPEAAEELQYLLGTFVNVKWRASMAQPRPGFKVWGRNQLLNMMQQQQTSVKEVSRPSIFSIQRVWVPLMAGLMIFILVGTVGTAAASTSSMPDQPLYPVKIATEQVRLTFAFTEEDKAVVNSQIAETRSEEIVVMAAAGKTAEVEATTEKMIESMDAAETAMNNVILQETTNVEPAATSQPTTTTTSEPTGEQPGTTSQTTASTSRNKSVQRVTQRVKTSINNNVNVMEKVYNQLPQQSKLAMQKAINAAKIRQEKIRKIVPENIINPEDQGKDNSGQDTKNFDDFNKFKPGFEPGRQGNEGKNDSGDDLPKDQNTDQTNQQDNTVNQNNTNTILPPKDGANIIFPPKDTTNIIQPPKDTGNTVIPPKTDSNINPTDNTSNLKNINTTRPIFRPYPPILDIHK